MKHGTYTWKTLCRTGTWISALEDPIEREKEGGKPYSASTPKRLFTRMGESSCHTYGYVMSRVCHVTHMGTSCHVRRMRVRRVAECVLCPRIVLSFIARHIYENTSCHTYGYVMSHGDMSRTWASHVTHGYVVSLVRHVTLIDTSCHVT